MTFFGMALLSAAGTIAAAVFAIVTAGDARRAFLKQSKKVSDQAEMLELQRRQLAEQEKTTAKQVEVLELQAVDLRESLNERKQEAEDRRRAQAAQVAAWFAWAPVTDGMFDGAGWGATVRNASGLPIYDISVFFHTAEEPVRGLGWDPSRRRVVNRVDPGSPAHERAAPCDSPGCRPAEGEVRRQRLRRQHLVHRRRREQVGT